MSNKPGSPGAEQHFYISKVAPTDADVVVGMFWSDLTAAILKRCSSISPITFVAAEHTESHTHASHTSIGTGDHHAQSHLHTVASGSGSMEREHSITIENPTATEDLSIFFTNKAITVTEMRAVLVGSATPSVTWTIRHGTDRSAAGAEVVTGGTVTTSVTTGSDVTSFNDATIVADSFVWLETTAKSGTVTELHVTIIYTVD